MNAIRLIPRVAAVALTALVSLGGAALGGAALAAAPVPMESPILAPRVASGELPPVAERMPRQPLVVDLEAKGRTFGQPGGSIRTIFTRARDIRYMTVYGYARLVGYDADFQLQPDLLLSVENEGDRVFTLTLREGHHWSDGAPFTTEDFRYWWEDVANHPELAPSGPPELMLVDDVPAEVAVLSETQIRFAWDAPNPRFLPALAMARPPFIYRPAHYLKQFHADYADPAQMQAAMRETRSRNWAQLHNNKDEMYRFENPAMPTLQPWLNTTELNSQRYILARNPFFHRIDARGVQLPYADQVRVEIAAGGLVTSKITLGEADLQIRTLSFSDAPVLRKGEATGGYSTFLWRNGAAAEIAIYPNLNYADPAFRALFRTADFRRALSLGIDRRSINRSLYYGLAKERTVAPLEDSPFFTEERAAAWAAFDPARANAMLDALGLDRRNREGTRLMADGRPLELVVETAGERSEEVDALQLVTESWREIGVKLIYRPLDRDILRNSAYQGESMMPVWFGWNNGLPTPDSPPSELAPVDQANFSWPMWGQHFQTKGAAGEPPDLPEAQRLLELFNAWNRAVGPEARAEIWEEMLDIHADQAFAIGLVSGAPQPVIVSNRLRNVPEDAVWSWDPGAHLGAHRMDEFHFADQ